MTEEVICGAGCKHDHTHTGVVETGKTESDVSATKTVMDLFGQPQLEAFALKSADMIRDGKPLVDGRKTVTATHFYDTDYGRVGTFFMNCRGLPVKMYVGTEDEIKAMQADFERVAKDAGVLDRNPREKAEARRKKRKALKKAKA